MATLVPTSKGAATTATVAMRVANRGGILEKRIPGDSGSCTRTTTAARFGASTP